MALQPATLGRLSTPKLYLDIPLRHANARARPILFYKLSALKKCKTKYGYSLVYRYTFLVT